MVEILSAKTRQLDLVNKKRVYARMGVKELWIIDPDQKKVTVYRFDQDPTEPVAKLGGQGDFEFAAPARVDNRTPGYFSSRLAQSTRHPHGDAVTFASRELDLILGLSPGQCLRNFRLSLLPDRRIALSRVLPIRRLAMGTSGAVCRRVGDGER